MTATDVEGLVALVSDDVHWPDDDAGRLHGKRRGTGLLDGAAGPHEHEQ